MENQAFSVDIENCSSWALGGKKAGLYVSFLEADRFLGSLTDLVSLMKIFFFFSVQASVGATLIEEIMGTAQSGGQNPRSWGINSPPLKGEETQSGEDTGRDFPTLEN